MLGIAHPKVQTSRSQSDLEKSCVYLSQESVEWLTLNLGTGYEWDTLLLQQNLSAGVLGLVVPNSLHGV